jgi:hypothetical protein
MSRDKWREAETRDWESFGYFNAEYAHCGRAYYPPWGLREVELKR